MHILSFGPDIVAAHSADEKVNIESTEKIYEIFVKLIEKL
jgi:di/tripeptidase